LLVAIIPSITERAMDDLFRFMALRAGERATPTDLVLLATDDKFQVALAGVHRQAPSPPGTPPRTPADPVRPSPLVPALRSAARRALTDVHGHPSRRPPPLPPPEGTHPTPPPDPIILARRIVEQFIGGEFGPGFLLDSFDVPWAASFDRLYAAAATLAGGAALAAAVADLFGQSAAALAATSEFQTLRRDLHDTIVAVIIHPGAHSLPLADLARLVRLMNLIVRVAAGDPLLDAPGASSAARDATLLLPPAIFPLRDDLPQPVGVGDLLVVRQTLKRYESGEIANIENILRGESRNKSTGHSLTQDNTTVTTTAKTTETSQSLDVTERFELKTETQNVVQEDIALQAGLSTSVKYGPVQINANANVAYSLSKEQSTKVASDHAKEVTTRAASRVVESLQRQEIARTIEKLYERERHGFDNTQGTGNVSGVYQWVNKVYEAQVYNYGKRLLFDLTVPEPAAFLHDALTEQETQQTLVAPQPMVVVLDTPQGRPVRAADLGADGQLKPGVAARPLTPADLRSNTADPFYYGHWAGLYGATGIGAPPEPFTTVSKGFTASKDDNNHLALADTLTIPQGYQAYSVAVQGAFTLYEEEDGDERMWVFVGKQRFECKGRGNLLAAAALLPLPQPSNIDQLGSIPIAVETQQARDFAITVDILCSATAMAITQWQIDTYASLVAAYTKLLGDWQDQVKARAVARTTQKSLGQNPAANRIIERTELKKACIARLAATDLVDAQLGDIHVDGQAPLFPRPNVPPAPNTNIVGGDQAAFLRFFEQVFEWEHMMYLFYPYYWARRERWYDNAIADNPDPLFAEFLKAGAARVVVPVRPQLEGDLRYYLMTGQIWGGGAMPGITDTDYLSITEEIKARDNAPGVETAQGEPWEVSLPTTLVRLRGDDTLPMWQKFSVAGRIVWVPGRVVNGNWLPDYGTLDGQGGWTPP